ncbi:hypothetical protein VTL71DRAFT_16076 [Oculimacula yallundae]|uniref:NAD(P)-binding protein n=1 Tax=Oculimacula yallundae TaxID=86028 RepID=A0ABR4CDF3_9HELO
MLSHPEFGFATTATEAAGAFGEEIRGKTVLITGISPSSIGSGLAHALASQSPALLILASRTLSNIQLVTSSIHKLYPTIRIAEIELDLSSLSSVRLAVVEIKRVVAERPGGEIDVLFNNAGINISWREMVGSGKDGEGEGEGWEKQFVTNYLGPWLFTGLVLPLMVSSKSAPAGPSPANSGPTAPQEFRRHKRIINTSSEAHRISPIRFSDLHQTPGVKVLREEEPRRGMPVGTLRGDGGYEPAIAYGMSKTANVLHCVELGRRFREIGVGSWAVSPGNIMTGLVRGADEQMLNGMLSGIPDSEWKTIDQGAATLVVAGFDPALEANDGTYLHDCQFKRPSKWASDPVIAERLWKVSKEMVGEGFDIETVKRGSGNGKMSRL